jgi:hypothetical protein
MPAQLIPEAHSPTSAIVLISVEGAWFTALLSETTARKVGGYPKTRGR